MGETSLSSYAQVTEGLKERKDIFLFFVHCLATCGWWIKEDNFGVWEKQL